MPITNTLSSLAETLITSKLYLILQALITVLSLLTLIYTCINFVSKKDTIGFTLQLALFTFLLLDLTLRGLAQRAFLPFMAKFYNILDLIFICIFLVVMAVRSYGREAGEHDWFINSCNVLILCCILGKSLISLGNTVCQLLDRKNIQQQGGDFKTIQISKNMENTIRVPINMDSSLEKHIEKEKERGRGKEMEMEQRYENFEDQLEEGRNEKEERSVEMVERRREELKEKGHGENLGGVTLQGNDGL